MPLRIAGWALAGAGVFLALPIALLLVAMAIALAGMLLTFIGLESAGTAANAAYSRWIETLFAPGAVPTYVPRLAVLAALVAAAAAAAGIVVSAFSNRAKRRSGHGLAGRLIGGPLSPADALRRVLRGALEPDSRRRAAGAATAGRARPPLRRARRRRTSASRDSASCCLFHDMDTRRDLVFALLAQNHRSRFFTRPGGESAARTAEAFDLTGSGATTPSMRWPPRSRCRSPPSRTS